MAGLDCRTAALVDRPVVPSVSQTRTFANPAQRRVASPSVLAGPRAQRVSAVDTGRVYGEGSLVAHTAARLRWPRAVPVC